MAVSNALLVSSGLLAYSQINIWHTYQVVCVLPCVHCVFIMPLKSSRSLLMIQLFWKSTLTVPRMTGDVSKLEPMKMMGSNNWIERDFETDDLRFHIIILLWWNLKKREKSWGKKRGEKKRLTWSLFIWNCQWWKKQVLICCNSILFIPRVIGSPLISLPVVQFHVTLRDHQPLQSIVRSKRCLGT